MQSYEVRARNGYTYTIQVADKDAERYGLTSNGPVNKAITPENKAHTEQPDERTAEQAKPASEVKTVKRPGAARRTK